MFTSCWSQHFWQWTCQQTRETTARRIEPCICWGDQRRKMNNYLAHDAHLTLRAPFLLTRVWLWSIIIIAGDSLLLFARLGGILFFQLLSHRKNILLGELIGPIHRPLGIHLHLGFLLNVRICICVFNPSDDINIVLSGVILLLEDLIRSFPGSPVKFDADSTLSVPLNSLEALEKFNL